MPSDTTFKNLEQFKKIENIFRMFKSAEELASEKFENAGGAKGNFAKEIYKIFIDLEGGVKPASKMISRIKEIFGGDFSPKNTDLKNIFNKIVDFYSSADQDGTLSNLSSAPFLVPPASGSAPDSIGANQIYGRICPKPDSIQKEKPVSFICLKSPYFSLLNRDVNAVETFLNFLPGTVISRCVPYVDLEIVFDRPQDNPPGSNPSSQFLQGPSLIRFLTDDKKISDFAKDSADSYTISARKKTIKGLDNEFRELHSSGMELFLSPQTLTNLSGDHKSRSFEVLDRTRPLLSLESLTINVDPTKGIASNKRATAAFKLHDRSRMSEVADLLQLNGVNRVSFWITYGWRHPTDSSGGDEGAQTYGQFINEKMLIKEAYNLVNASYAFDQTGQVTITVEMYTQGFLDAMTIGIEEDQGFSDIRKRQKELTSAISRFRERYNLSSLNQSTKEVRPFMVLNSAAGGSFPSLEEKELLKGITELIKVLNSEKQISKEKARDIKILEENLKEYYSFSDKKGSKKSISEENASIADAIIAKKFETLSSSPDPFIAWDGKNDARKVDTGEEYSPAYKDTIGPLLKGSLGKNKKIVSFGKLFATFMVPAINSSDFVDESQIFFYTINDKAGKASSIPISEFPIVLEDFKTKYTEWVEKRGSSSMTISEFISLAVLSNFKNLSSPAFGFSIDLLAKNKESGTWEAKNLEQFSTTSLSFNKGRGPFQFPEISVYCEMVFAEEDGVKSFDRLALYEKTATFKQRGGDAKKILRVHVVDTGAIPDTSRLFAARDEFGPISLDQFGNQDTKGVSIKADKSEIERNTKILNGNQREFSFQEIGITGVVASKRSATISSRETLRQAIAYSFPTLIPGMNTSAIIEATVASRSDPAAKAAILTGVKSGRELMSGPRGADIGNLPVRVVPSEVSMKTLGCPLISFAQNFFVDMNTGTTIDNVYSVSQLTHSFAPGKFETSFKLAPWDSYARIESADSTIRSLIGAAQEALDKAIEVDGES
jgi:hypothetical protein